jgi:hypothetical protein
MPYCKYCRQRVPADASYHDCPKHGLLDLTEDNSFIVSAVIGAATDSTLLGGIIGGDIAGGLLGDILDGDLFD